VLLDDLSSNRWLRKPQLTLCNVLKHSRFAQAEYRSLSENVPQVVVINKKMAGRSGHFL
jgi:hypothetical protein